MILLLGVRFFASAALVLLSVVAAAAAGDSLPPKSAAPASASKPLIVENPDGTFTIQKVPPKGNSKNGKAGNGLVIPPQVVMPIFSPAEKKHDATPHR